MNSNGSANHMTWWQEARLGLFIHWGLYSMLGGTWKEKTVRGYSEQIMFWARIKEKEYSKLSYKFYPKKFNAKEWVRSAKMAGMKYIVVTAKHHDGFCLFKSKLTNYNVVDSTPFKRDVLLELADACQKEGIKLCLYYSLVDWHWVGGAGIFSRYRDFPKYLEYIKGQLRELLTNYGPIGLMFFDGDWMPQWNSQISDEIETLCRSLQPELIINNRLKKRPINVLNHLLARWVFKSTLFGDYDTPEQFIPNNPPKRDWEVNMSMNKSFGYKESDTDWKSEALLIKNLSHIASKGGNYLLNVGPMGSGEFPQASVNRLKKINQWLGGNGESIYGTSRSTLLRQSWGWITEKPGNLYLHVADWPEQLLVVKGFDKRLKSAYFLADGNKNLLKFKNRGRDLHISVPAKSPDEAVAVISLLYSS